MYIETVDPVRFRGNWGWHYFCQLTVFPSFQNCCLIIQNSPILQTVNLSMDSWKNLHTAICKLALNIRAVTKGPGMETFPWLLWAFALATFIGNNRKVETKEIPTTNQWEIWEAHLGIVSCKWLLNLCFGFTLLARSHLWYSLLHSRF